jgi:hypothetical protein
MSGTFSGSGNPEIVWTVFPSGPQPGTMTRTGGAPTDPQTS